jgi:hypothetical protein
MPNQPKTKNIEVYKRGAGRLVPEGAYRVEVSPPAAS